MAKFSSNHKAHISTIIRTMARKTSTMNMWSQTQKRRLQSKRFEDVNVDVASIEIQMQSLPRQQNRQRLSSLNKIRELPSPIRPSSCSQLLQTIELMWQFCKRNNRDNQRRKLTRLSLMYRKLVKKFKVRNLRVRRWVLFHSLHLPPLPKSHKFPSVHSSAQFHSA